MNIQQLRSRRDLAGISYTLAFFKIFAWDKPQDFVPLKRDDKKKSVTRLAMEKAALYLRDCEQGRGLEPKKVTAAFAAIKNWKKYFVLYMKEKDNQQLVESCQNRIWTAKLANKTVKCNHKDHLLGEDGAAKLADSLFRMFYDGEVRAAAEPTIDPYFTREAGAVEFGQSMSSAEFLPRQFAEQPTGDYYLQSEDEAAVPWSMTDEFGTDDEIVKEDIEILPVNTDWEDRNERYFQLRQDLLHRKFSGEKIIRKARFLAETEMISWGQYGKLRSFAGDVAMFGNK